jgi:hypothetical protein
MKNLYRRYKISLINNDGITTKEKEIVEFILSKIKDLTLFVDEYGFRNYMNIENEWVFENDIKNGITWFKYDGFMQVLDEKYRLSVSEIQNVIEDVIKNIYKINVGMVSINSLEIL